MAPHLKKTAKNKFAIPPKKKSFKHPGKNSDEVTESPPPSIPLQLEDDDALDFPRGGGGVLSRKEIDEVRADVDAKFEAEDRVLKRSYKKTGKKGKKMNEETEDVTGSLFGGGIMGKLPRFANTITLKNISIGMKLWGVISEVNEKDIVVSLPGGLRGLVRAYEAIGHFLIDSEIPEGSEANYLSSIYQVGQLVSCVVVQLDEDRKENGKRKIWLSLHLNLLHKGLTLDYVQEGMVINARVKSIEDHGYILNFGVSSFTGFVPKSNLTVNRDVRLTTGQLIQGVVKRIDKIRKIVYLTSDADLLSKYVTKDLKGLSIDFLVPGMMVNARVHSTLDNGVMLSFLTYFTGTVDVFNLENSFPSSNWKDEYNQNKRVNARILFVDPATRAIGLTLNPYLVGNKAPPSLVKTGDIFDQSKVIRVDRRFGLLLEIATSPVPTPAFVGVHDVADKEVRNLEKSFRAENLVRLRVLGFRHMEGLAIGVLKTSAIEGSVFTHSDVKPGMMLKAKVIAVESFGAIVQLGNGVKALCPLRHMSEFEIAKPRKKFQVGAELLFRVLGCKSKRITVTHKKTLVKSKLQIISSYADATEGFITHGWITKIENHGCFVRFYNGVHGFAPRFEVGLDPGSDISSSYKVEQVVKCRVTDSNPLLKRIRLSFNITPSRGFEGEVVKSGGIVSGVVEQVMAHSVIVNVNAMGNTKGTIHPEHLSDHYGLAALMKSVLKPGYEFDQLLILDVEGGNLVLSAKYSLINKAEQLPRDSSQIQPQSIVPSYICNIIESGCFVRFLGRLTGFSPRSKAIDNRKANLSEAFYIGQSVRSSILDVDTETGRITVSLKQASCSSLDGCFIQEYFLLAEKIARAQVSDASQLKWVDKFPIGSVVEGKVVEIKQAGVLISFESFEDVFGFITHYQLAGKLVEAGSTVQAVVLDVSTIEQLVDLSLKPMFLDKVQEEGLIVQAHKKKRKSVKSNCLELNQTVNAVVEIVKENYVVLSLAEHNYILGYASLTDYNVQKFATGKFVHGQSVIASVAALPSSSTAGRLLFVLNSFGEVDESLSSKRSKKNKCVIGSLVLAEVTEIKPLEMRLKFGSGFLGRIHITEVNDENTVEDPFSNYKIGVSLTARIVSKQMGRKGYIWELSIKKSMLTASFVLGGNILDSNFSYPVGQEVTGFVYKVDKEWIWLTISRSVNAGIYVLDSSSEPAELEQFQKRFYVGKVLSGYVLNFNQEKRLLRLTLHPLSHADEPLGLSDKNVPSHIHEGDIVGGRISKIFPGVGGLLVQIDPHLSGKVAFTELTKSLVPEPLSGYHEGQFVKCKVLETRISDRGFVQVDLSLRLASHDHLSTDTCDNLLSSSQRVEKIEDLSCDMMVQGYVKTVGTRGCFIMLSRKIDAKILLSNLSDNYIENPEKDFPVGKLITGKVRAVDPLSNRVEITLKTSNIVKRSTSDIIDLSNVHVGDIVHGRIKRVESYGLFIVIDGTNLVALCHISELSGDHIDNIESKYRAGDNVIAKVLKVDDERHRICLGMKNSYLVDDTNIKKSSEQRSRGLSGSDEFSSGMLTAPQHSGAANAVDWENEKNATLLKVESRASVPPLDVPLDYLVDSDIDDNANANASRVDVVDSTVEQKKRRAKRKENEAREREIRAAEERLLENGIPESSDDFEKLIRSSPNSSFLWLKYMAFKLSLPKVEEARSIAERALKTINIREEAEKLNIWVAYFNLEIEYGNPPEDSVAELFKRALQYCDPKKVHLALLGVYERTKKHQLADELLDKMVKKFKHSCKIWLRQIQRLLMQNQDGVQSVVNRALLCLPRHKHIKFITQTAILEFKCGLPERGRSLFDRMLLEYPKRTDLWSVYLDQEIRLGDADVIRSLLERSISLSLHPKKMKFLFKKYLEYETSQGDEERIEYVKKKAMKYVENSLS